MRYLQIGRESPERLTPLSIYNHSPIPTHNFSLNFLSSQTSSVFSLSIYPLSVIFFFFLSLQLNSGFTSRVMQQADQTVINLRPGGGPRGTRFLGPRFDSSSSSLSDAQPLRSHGGFASSSALKVGAKNPTFFVRSRVSEKKSNLFWFSFLSSFFFLFFF